MAKPKLYLLSALQRPNGERLRAKLAGARVRIWSSEHGAWWRPARSGYCTEVAGAGIYTFEDAWDATKHCSREKQIAFYPLEKDGVSAPTLTIIKASQAVRDIILEYVRAGGTVLPGEPVPWARAAKAVISQLDADATTPSRVIEACETLRRAHNAQLTALHEKHMLELKGLRDEADARVEAVIKAERDCRDAEWRKALRDKGWGDALENIGWGG